MGLKNCLLIFFVIVCFHPLIGQVGVHLDKTLKNKHLDNERPQSLIFLQSRLFNFSSIRTPIQTGKIKGYKIQDLPQAYSYQDLAPFCKVEVKIEKALKKTFKFRLGTLDYVNYLEQK